jgi:hypothetical protein
MRPPICYCSRRGRVQLQGRNPPGPGPAGSRLGLIVAGALLLGCAGEQPPEGNSEIAVGSRQVPVSGRDESGAQWIDGPSVEITPQDVAILRAKLDWGRSSGLATTTLGDAMARLGRTFVGTTYTPGTLEVDGPERIVVNLRELDCVTFVESVYALSVLIRDPSLPEAPADAELVARYAREIEALRYRGGRLQGYPSRLHYFSEWISDNAMRGNVRDVTRELGGVPYPDPVDFMSTHPEAYRQLEDPGFLEEIRKVESRLGTVERFRIPEGELTDAGGGILDGDIIAATSTIRGLDVAHTGIALWQDGKLHLLHAPLVGREVEISELPLAQRIQGIKGQDGVMVARPLTRGQGEN